MGFKFRKHKFRTGEVIEPTRIRENMQTLAHEFNGNLDRENLPMFGLGSKSIKAGAFNRIVQRTGDETDKVSFYEEKTSIGSLTSKTSTKVTSYQPVMEIRTDVKVDSVIVAHFGGTIEWLGMGSEMNDITGDATTNDHFNDKHTVASGDFAHNKLREYVASFRLRINGETVCEVQDFSFLRQLPGVYLTGSLPVSAGSVQVIIEGRLFKDADGIELQSEALAFDVTDRNLLAHIKKR